MGMSTIKLEEAKEADAAFSYEVTESAVRVHVLTTWGAWDPDVQQCIQSATFTPRTHRIVVVDGERAGIVAVESLHSYLQLGKLYLLPPFRSQGIGSRLLQDLMCLASSDFKLVRLRVLRVNAAAQRFYLRHGFLVTSVTTERVFMEATAGSPGSSAASTRLNWPNSVSP